MAQHPHSGDPLPLEVCGYYRDAPPQHRHYVRIKLRSDPLTSELVALCGSYGHLGKVLDAGCGRGQFGLLLVACGAATQLLGFDHDDAKVQVATAAAALCSRSRAVPVEFNKADLATVKWPNADTILLLDVLHYLPESEQLTVLVSASRALQPGGRLFIRETSRGVRWSARLAAGFERLGRVLGINQGRSLTFLPPGQLEEQLGGEGLRVRRHEPRGALKNVLIVAEKADAPV